MKRKTNFVVFSFVCLGTMILASCGATPHTHTFVEHGEVAATCTAPGNKKYFTCSAESCKDKIFDADKNETTAEAITIAALGHNFGAPTVTWDGSAATATAKCTRCTVSETETKTGTFVPESVATCVSKATGHYHVVFDKASFGSADSPTIEVGDYGPHHVHEVAGQAATCTAAGFLKHYECDTEGCGKLFADQTATDEITDLDAWKAGAGRIAPIPHVTELVSGLAPTCVLPGYKDAYQCTVCRHYFEDQAGTKAIESLTDWRSYGGAGYLPSNPEAHSLVKVDGQAATCSAAGWKDYYQCERALCAKLFEDELGLTPIADLAAWKAGSGKIDPIAHTTVEVPGQAATCTEAGYKSAWKCSMCEQYFEEKAATTLIGGAAAYALWASVGDGVIPPHAHSGATLVPGLAETCTTAGYENAWTCGECKQFFSAESLAADKLIGDEDDYALWILGDGLILPHDHHNPSKVDGQAPTCVLPGYKDAYTCAECKQYFSAESLAEDKLIGDADAYAAWKQAAGKIEPTGIHSNPTLVPGQAETCTEPGYEDAWTCQVCGQYFSAESLAEDKLIGDADDYAAWKLNGGKIEPHDHHNPSKVDGQAPTCAQPGFADAWTCGECGQYFSAESLANDKLIGDADDYAAWKLNGGKLDPTGLHTYGDLIPQVDPTRTTDGCKAHYQCSVCKSYFNESFDEVSYDSLILKATATHFDKAKDASVVFDEPIDASETIYVDVKFIDAVADSKINIALMGSKDDKTDWDNYFGYFAIFEKSIDSNAGIYAETITDDGYLRIKIVMPELTKISGERPSKVQQLYIRGGWSNVEGYIEVNSSLDAHTKGDTLISAKAAGPHGDDGYQAHYECKGCSNYWFNESGKVCKKEDLVIKSNVVQYAPPASGNTLAEFKNLGNITDKVSIDVHFDNPTKHQEIGFNFYESAWDNYYGTFWLDCDEKGVYFEKEYEGITLDELADGWYRVTAYPSALNYFVKDKEIDQKRSIDFIYIKAPNTVENRGSGMFELNSSYDQIVPSTKVYSMSGEKYVTDRVFLPGETINIDVKIKNNTKINFALLSGWDSVLTFNVKPDGTLEDQKNGVQVFKLNNELPGYPTLDGTWYRIVINTNYITPLKDNWPTIMRIGGNKWNGAEFDMMINSPYTTDGWYTFQGGSTDTQINVKSANVAVFRDEDGELLENKAVSIKVKAEGSGQAKFSLMEHDSWKNCGNLVLKFADNKLTEALIQGSANKWATIVDLGADVYELVIPLDKLPGDGFAQARSIGFFYGTGVVADGLTSFSINLLDVCMVDL